MSNLKKLSREQMKKVLGGSTEPECPENECGGSAGSCTTGKTCHSAACPKDASLLYNYCA